MMMMMMMIIGWMHVSMDYSRLFTSIEVMNVPPFLLQYHSFFRKHLQANGCIAGDDSRCIVVSTQLYCGLKL